MYLKNMRNMLMEQLTESELIVVTGVRRVWTARDSVGPEGAESNGAADL